MLVFFAFVNMFGQTNNALFISEQGNGLYTFRSTGYGKDVKQAIVDAEKAVFKLIFFRGAPGIKNFDKPMVSSNESKSMEEHKGFFDEFFDGGRYKSFITKSQQMNKFGKNGNTQKNITIEVTVNLNVLKSDLESQKVVRKFGY